MKAIIKQIKGMSLAGKADSGHWVTLDGPEALGGYDAAARPMELFLLGVGGCTSMDVISILAKKRMNVEDFALELETDRAEEHPKVFTRIRMKYIITGKNIKEEAVRRAIELSQEKYCSASAMLKPTVPVETSFEIRSSKDES
ncbi:OsmC family protein [candidate division KSB1 bacterium]|nr:OsmC family protein [candidate division KSB1 bacterium]